MANPPHRFSAPLENLDGWAWMMTENSRFFDPALGAGQWPARPLDANIHHRSLTADFDPAVVLGGGFLFTHALLDHLTDLA